MTSSARPRSDATPLLVLYVFLLFALPSRLVFAPLGAAGAPAQLLGMTLLGAYVVLMVTVDQHYRLPLGRQPLVIAVMVLLAALVASWVAASSRPLEAVELRSADRALLNAAAWCGVFLVVSQGIQTRERLDRLLRALVFAAGAVAALGILQFLTHLDLTGWIQVPGLSSNAPLFSVTGREGLSRPAGTALHPIEFGVALAAVLPLAIHYALEDLDRAVTRRWAPVLLIAVAVPISISRSAVLAATIVLACLLPTWDGQARRRCYALVLGLLFGLYLFVPGLLGTFRKLFTGLSQDGSALSRTDSYATAWTFICRAPIFGRGVGTFLPSYRILDNQYLGTVIETGAIGLAALLGLFLTGLSSARAVRCESAPPRDRALAQSLLAALAALACSFATFDALGFPIVAGLTFLLLGAVGGLSRLQVDRADEVPITPCCTGSARAPTHRE